jgi:hypothetical protein
LLTVSGEFDDYEWEEDFECGEVDKEDLDCKLPEY